MITWIARLQPPGTCPRCGANMTPGRLIEGSSRAKMVSLLCRGPLKAVAGLLSASRSSRTLGEHGRAESSRHRRRVRLCDPGAGCRPQPRPRPGRRRRWTRRRARTPPPPAPAQRARPAHGLCPLRARLRGPATAISAGPVRWRGLLVCAIERTTMTIPDSPRNLAAYGRQAGSHGGSGYPLLRLVALVALVACGTRTIIDAVFGPTSCGELDYAGCGAACTPSMLVLAEGNFGAAAGRQRHRQRRRRPDRRRRPPRAGQPAT